MNTYHECRADPVVHGGHGEVLPVEDLLAGAAGRVPLRVQRDRDVRSEPTKRYGFERGRERRERKSERE